jgi:hypothetical protein
MIESRTQLYERLSNMVVSQLPMTNECMNDVMAYVIGLQMEHADNVGKWIKNCDILMRKLNENRQNQSK